MQKHKPLAFLLALVIALGLWFYAVTVVNPNDSVTINNIKVRFDGADVLEARQLMMTGGEEARVNVRVSGRRSDLKELNNETVTAVASLSRITEAGDTQVSWTLEYPATVAAGDISVDSRSSLKVKVHISDVLVKEFPVRMDYSVSTAENFWTEQNVLSLSEDSVFVTGPEEEIARLGHVSVTLHKSGLKEQVDEEVPCDWFDVNGEPTELSSFCTASTDSIHLTLPIYHSRVLNLTVACKAGAGATEEDANISIIPSTVLVTGSLEELSELDSNLVIDEVDLAEIHNQTIFRVKSSEINAMLPDKVTSRLVTSRVTVSVQLANIVEKTILVPVEQISRLDNMETLRLKAGQTVPVRLRGSSEQLDKLEAEQLNCTVNLATDYDARTGEVIVKVQLPNGCTAGVLEIGTVLAEGVE